jgi:hypothetical protein
LSSAAAAYAGACEVADDGDTEAAAADDKYAAGAQFCLAGGSNFAEGHLAGVVGDGRAEVTVVRVIVTRAALTRVPVIVMTLMRVVTRRSASLAIYPARVPIFIVLLLPNGHPVFDFIDDVTARRKGFGTMARAHSNPNRHLTYRQVTNAMHARRVLYTESLDGLGNDAFAFLNGEQLECFVLKMSNRMAFVVVADPTLERCVTACNGIEQLRAQRRVVNLLASEAECRHIAAPSTARDGRNEDYRIAVGEVLRPFAELVIYCHAQHLGS